MKNLFEINESEKQRILGMHIDATKKFYLNEQKEVETVKNWDSGVIPAYFPTNKGQINDLPKEQLDVLNKKVDEMAKILEDDKWENKKINMTIEASTSKSGSRQRNKELADERLLSAKNYIMGLLNQKINPEILKNITITEDKKIQQGEGVQYQYFRIKLNAEYRQKDVPVEIKQKSKLEPYTIELTTADWELTPVEYRAFEKSTPDTRNVVLGYLIDNRTDPPTKYYLPTPSPVNPAFKLINPNTGKVTNSPRPYYRNEKLITDLSLDEFKLALEKLPSVYKNVFLPRAEKIYNNQITPGKEQVKPQQ